MAFWHFLLRGPRRRLTTVGTGNFYCPKCRSVGPYRLREASEQNTVFGIGVSSVRRRRFVECEGCQEQFDGDVLDSKPEDPRERQLVAAHLDLLAGQSLGSVQVRLEERGLPSDQAEKAVLDLCGGKVLRCGCGRRYHWQARQCLDCNVSLPLPTA